MLETLAVVSVVIASVALVANVLDWISYKRSMEK